MIRHLAIRNLAVIDSVAIEFEPAFNVLTGETGAGKSIVVEAVGLLLGGRAAADLVRTGEQTATIEALFDTGADEIALRREITAQGKTRAYISGSLATAAQLKLLSSQLLELHGQHEHQALLDPVQHLPLLDAWAGLREPQARVASAFAEVQQLRQELDRRRMDSRERSARLELVDFALAELNSAGLRAGEDDELLSQRQILRAGETVRRLCEEGYSTLYDSEDAVMTGLGVVWKRVADLATIDPRFTPYLEQRDSIKAQLEDLAASLRHGGDDVDISGARLEQVEQRLALIERLKRKHGGTLSQVIDRREALAQEHADLTNARSTADAEHALGDATQRFLAAARALSSARQQAMHTLAAAVTAELAELAMPHAQFDMRLTSDEEPSQWSGQGIDRGEFYLSANPGEQPKPLSRIASGGELSRVMLALHTLGATGAAGVTGAASVPDAMSATRVAGAHARNRTLVFDEVDAGIGGRVATVVGERLRRLGQHFQVLCITHLPQIAAAGETHFHVAKTVRGLRTVTSVTRLDGEQRVAELARMMGGAHAGEQARASARELLSGAANARALETGRAAQAKAKVSGARRSSAR